MVDQISNWTLEDIYKELEKDEVTLKTKLSYSHLNKTENKSKRLSLGRIWFNTILPDDFRFIDEKVDKNMLDDIIFEISKKYTSSEAAEYLNRIQIESYKLGTLSPNTIDINMFTPSDEWLEAKKKFIEKADDMSDKEFNDGKQKLINKLDKELKSLGIGFMDVLDAKSSGKMSKDTWAVLQISKGVTVDIEDNIHRIKEGIADGYSIKNYYTAANEARNGFYIKSTAVRDPGYLARKVVMANAGVYLDDKDCKSKQYLNIFVDAKRAKTLIGRYMVSDTGKLELIESADQITNKQIKIRSPFFCKSKTGICSVCYGKLSEKLENKNIGILAGGAINMEAVNAMMKMRHKAEKVEIIEVNFIESIKKSTINLGTLKHILNIREKEILAKDDILITIDTHEYDDKSLIEHDDKYVLPGLLNIKHGDENPEFYYLPFNFDVNLFKSNNTRKKGRIINIYYSAGEKVLSKDKYPKRVNPAVITKILDGVTKYTKDPKALLDMLIDELSGLDSCHLEVVISNLFRSEADNKIPSRLNNYKDPVIIGCKQLPFIDSWLTGLAFENINKAMENGIVNEEDAIMNPLEKVLTTDTYRKK